MILMKRIKFRLEDVDNHLFAGCHFISVYRQYTVIFSRLYLRKRFVFPLIDQ